MPESRLSLAITHADGRVTRWGPDEPDGKDIPADLTFTDTIPGGHATLTTSLLRRIDVTHSDEQLFADVHVYGPGGRTAWRGRLQTFPRTHGDGYGVSPGAVGWSAHLRDDPSFREVYVDRSMGSWGTPPLSRRVALLTGGVSMGDFSWNNEAGGLVAALPNQALSAQTIAELMYDIGPGLKVAAVEYVGSSNSVPAGWVIRFFAGDNEDGSAASNYTPTNDGAPHGITLSPAGRYVGLQYYSSGSAATPAAGSSARYSKTAAFGNHGLTLRAVTGDLSGVYGSDVIADVVSRAAPLLNYTTGADGSIEPTTFAIQHLAYRDPVTAEFVISDINKHHLYDWGVYDNREFFYRQPDPTRLLWEARLSDGAHLDADGDDGEQVINGVFVTYTDHTGAQKTVGPPGGNFDSTDSLLADTSSTNPVNAAGIPRKWVPLSLTFPATLSQATQIGYVYLLERSLAGRRGTVTLRNGTVTHPTEGKVPAWRVRAGDWISLKDLNGAEVPRKIINKTYSHASGSVQLQLDNTVAKVDAILARVGVLAGIQSGGGF